MNRTSKPFTAFTVILALGFAAGCGAPDLAAMRPQVSKSSAAIFYVDHPSMESGTGLNHDEEGRMVYKTIDVSTGDFETQIASALTNDDLNFVVVVVDNAAPYSTFLSQLAQKYADIHFEVLSDQPGTFPSLQNLRTVSANPDLVAYGIGYLVGTYLSWLATKATVSSTYGMVVQPTLGYVKSTAPKDQQEAFFAGLYTADASAQVVPLASSSGTSASQGYPGSSTAFGYVNALPLSGVVYSSALSKSTIAALASQTNTFFSFGDEFSGLPCLIRPGHLSPTEVSDAISAAERGQWQPGNEEKIDFSSIALQTSALPPSVSEMWGSLQTTLSTSTTDWRQKFEQLPTQTRSMLSTQFGST
ncbi:hypothetical protein [Alicyclobacillus acidiphilus]|uniref:hypothetical protein n=1 Tax=Alicyclobacillus acidiphilus TaxID=182455 RepID=UPI00082A3872|nr:hypothetical protein [Alicyclobacillus acidiphilus]